jgi:hypothetical protein
MTNRGACIAAFTALSFFHPPSLVDGHAKRRKTAQNGAKRRKTAQDGAKRRKTAQDAQDGAKLVVSSQDQIGGGGKSLAPFLKHLCQK